MRTPGPPLRPTQHFPALLLSTWQEFDALVVANGHYHVPNLPQVEGSATFLCVQMHSHNYRTPEAFQGQAVLVVGASNSGAAVVRGAGDP